MMIIGCDLHTRYQQIRGGGPCFHHTQKRVPCPSRVLYKGGAFS
jgi:hypothetical protein